MSDTALDTALAEQRELSDEQREVLVRKIERAFDAGELGNDAIAKLFTIGKSFVADVKVKWMAKRMQKEEAQETPVEETFAAAPEVFVECCVANGKISARACVTSQRDERCFCPKAVAAIRAMRREAVPGTDTSEIEGKKRKLREDLATITGRAERFYRQPEGKHFSGPALRAQNGDRNPSSLIAGDLPAAPRSTSSAPAPKPPAPRTMADVVAGSSFVDKKQEPRPPQIDEREDAHEEAIAAQELAPLDAAKDSERRVCSAPGCGSMFKSSKYDKCWRCGIGMKKHRGDAPEENAAGDRVKETSNDSVRNPTADGSARVSPPGRVEIPSVEEEHRPAAKSSSAGASVRQHEPGQTQSVAGAQQRNPRPQVEPTKTGDRGDQGTSGDAREPAANGVRRQPHGSTEPTPDNEQTDTAQANRREAGWNTPGAGSTVTPGKGPPVPNVPIDERRAATAAVSKPAVETRSLAAIEEATIREAYARLGGSIIGLELELGLGRTTVHRKLDTLGLPRKGRIGAGLPVASPVEQPIVTQSENPVKCSWTEEPCGEVLKRPGKNKLKLCKRHRAVLKKRNQRTSSSQQECSFEGCSRRLDRRNKTGLCIDHFNNPTAAASVSPEDARICAESGCGKILGRLNQSGKCDRCASGIRPGGGYSRCSSPGCPRRVQKGRGNGDRDKCAVCRGASTGGYVPRTDGGNAFVAKRVDVVALSDADLVELNARVTAEMEGRRKQAAHLHREASARVALLSRAAAV